MSFVLIDSSIWIDLLRTSSREDDLSRMQSLLTTREAAWCGMIQLELWAGIRDSRQRTDLDQISTVVHDLEITKTVWQEAYRTAALARSKGITAPASDFLIYTCARVYKIEIWHRDKHFDALAKL